VTKPNVFQLIDLDRTLFDTSKFAKALTDELNKVHPGLGTQLDEQFEKAYAREETFFLLRYLRQEMGNQQFEALVDEVVAKQPEKGAAFKLPGFHARLELADTLSSRTPGWGILTYGDPIDQLMKMKLVGLEGAPMYCTPSPNKGETIAQWQQEDGRFHLPDEYGGGIVDTLTFEDDKYRAFLELPKGVFGIWLTRDPQATERLGELDGTVISVASLDEASEYLRTSYLKK